MVQWFCLISWTIFHVKTPYFLILCQYYRKFYLKINVKKSEKIQVVPQSQSAALLRHQEEEETEKSEQAQIEQTYEKL